MPNQTGITDKLKDGEYLAAWRQIKDEHPVAYAASAVLPVTGQVAAAMDYADAMDRGDSTDGAIAAASFIPGVGITKAARSLKYIAPAQHELDIAKIFSPRSARAMLAPATERAQKIGLAADAEQIGETTTKEVQKSRAEDPRKAENEEYDRAWGERG